MLFAWVPSLTPSGLWGCRCQGTDGQVLLIPSGSCGTPPRAGRVLLTMLRGARGNLSGGIPNPHPLQSQWICWWNSANGMAVGTPGIQAVFQRSLQRDPLCSPGSPNFSCQSSADPKLLAVLCQIPKQSCCAAVTAAAVAPEIIPREVLNWEPFKYLDFCSF